MLTVTNAYNTAMASISRDLTFRVVLNGTTAIDDSELVSIEIEENGSSECINIGEFCRNKCTVKTLNSSSWLGGYFQVYQSAGGEEISLGIYHVNEVSTKDNGKTFTITGYDLTDNFSNEYDSENGLTSSASIATYICSNCGMSFVTGTTITDFTISSVPTGTTNQQMLAYIAGCMGKNIRTNRNGELELYWYADSGKTIGQSEEYMDNLDLTVEETSINSLTAGWEDTAYTAGSGYGIHYSNPYITQAMVDSIFTAIGTFSFYPLEVKYRGNGALQVGDIVQVASGDTNKTVYIMQQSFTIDGGMNSTIECYDNKEEKAVISQSLTDQKISASYTGMKNALQEAMATFLEGHGYYSLVKDPSGTNIGWQITDSPTITNTTKGWRWTYGGLMWTTDGFKSVNNVAITNDGHIVGTFITGLVISADQLEVNLAATINNTATLANNLGVYFRFDSSGAHVGRAGSDFTNTFDEHSLKIAYQNVSQLTINETGVDGINGTFHKYLTVGDHATQLTARMEHYADDIDNDQIATFLIPRG